VELKGTFYNKPLHLGNRPNLFHNFYENSAHNANLDVPAECAQRHLAAIFWLLDAIFLLYPLRKSIGIKAAK